MKLGSVQPSLLGRFVALKPKWQMAADGKRPWPSLEAGAGGVCKSCSDTQHAARDPDDCHRLTGPNMEPLNPRYVQQVFASCFG